MFIHFQRLNDLSTKVQNRAVAKEEIEHYKEKASILEVERRQSTRAWPIDG
jgi:hypothetical protein